jgi:hypothetical protein
VKQAIPAPVPQIQELVDRGFKLRAGAAGYEDRFGSAPRASRGGRRSLWGLRPTLQARRPAMGRSEVPLLDVLLESPPLDLGLLSLIGLRESLADLRKLVTESTPSALLIGAGVLPSHL